MSSSLKFCSPQSAALPPGIRRGSGLLVLLLIAQIATAQLPLSSPTTTNKPKDSPNESNTPFKIYEDSFDLSKVYYARYDLEAPQYDRRIALDTVTISDSEYELSKKQRIPFLDLGRIGSPVRPVFASYQPKRRYIDLGVHAWDLYFHPVKKALFYRQTIPISQAFVSQGINGANTTNSLQDNTLVDLHFSRNFAGGRQGVIDYRRVVDLGFYDENRSSITSFKSALLYTPDSSRWIGALTYAFNEVIREENGGIIEDSLLFDDTLHALRFSIPTYLSDAHLRYTGYTLTAYNRLYLHSKKKGFYLHDNLSYQTRTFKYYDQNTNSRNDSVYYGPLQVDQRGLSLYLTGREISNDLYAGFQINEKSEIRIGGIGQWSWWRNDTSGRKYTLFRPYVHALWDWGKTGYSKHRIELAVLDRKGWETTHHFILHPKKWGAVEACLFGSSKPATLLEEWRYVSQHNIQDTSYLNITRIEGSMLYTSQSLHLSMGVRSIAFRNFLYWDTSGTPVQVKPLIRATEFHLRHIISLGHFYMRNAIFFTASEHTGILLIPRWSTRHNLFLQHPIYNADTRLRYGLSIDFQKGGNMAPGYFPLVGQYIANRVHYPYDYSITVAPYLMLKVPQFSIFARVDRAEDLLQQRLWHYAQDWPAPDWEFRLGIKWTLVK